MADLKHCSWCWRNWGIDVMVRRDSECPKHHSLRTCEKHGAINCFEGKDGCPGSAR